MLHGEVLKEELSKQIARGWMIPMTYSQAVRKFGEKSVAVAALAVIQEKTDQYRVLHDGSNLVQVNNRIHVQDAEQYPSAADVQCAIHFGNLELPILGMSTDVEKAHRQTPVDERDWGLMACSTEQMPARLEGWQILVNTVQTYGMASASSAWATPASMLQRFADYICKLAWIFRFADDFMVIASSCGGRRCTLPVARFMALFAMLNVPCKWSKTRGGFTTDFIGYLFCWENLKGGMTERRATWLSAWAERIATTGSAETRDLKGGLGRMAFSAVLLRHILPFLGPLYGWIAVLPREAVWPLPAAIIVILYWLAAKLKQCTLVELRLPMVKRAASLYKADAKAEGMEVSIGEFESPLPGQSLKQRRWFAYTLDGASAPWAFANKAKHTGS